ncbi:hypothetical protein HDU96_000018 [Phlyctochytrium bullatum]|nr:hypothetical protein HDU96_000018 [Phlyctochytrium bullatum]
MVDSTRPSPRRTSVNLPPNLATSTTTFEYSPDRPHRPRRRNDSKGFLKLDGLDDSTEVEAPAASSLLAVKAHAGVALAAGATWPGHFDRDISRLIPLALEDPSASGLSPNFTARERLGGEGGVAVAGGMSHPMGSNHTPRRSISGPSSSASSSSSSAPSASVPNSPKRRVVFVDPDDAEAPWWWPALVVLPSEFEKFRRSVDSDVAEPKDGEYLVCYFEDGSYSVIPESDAVPFNPQLPPYTIYVSGKDGSRFKSDNAVKLATQYWTTGVPPPAFAWLNDSAAPVVDMTNGATASAKKAAGSEKSSVNSKKRPASSSSGNGSGGGLAPKDARKKSTSLALTDMQAAGGHPPNKKVKRESVDATYEGSERPGKKVSIIKTTSFPVVYVCVATSATPAITERPK